VASYIKGMYYPTESTIPSSRHIGSSNNKGKKGEEGRRGGEGYWKTVLSIAPRLFK